MHPVLYLSFSDSLKHECTREQMPILLGLHTILIACHQSFCTLNRSYNFRKNSLFRVFYGESYLFCFDQVQLKCDILIYQVLTLLD